MAFKAGTIYGDAVLDTKKWNRGLKGLVKGIGLAGAAIAGAFAVFMGKAIGKADEFQKAMSNVSTLIDTTAISTQELTLDLLSLDSALGKTTELTNGLYQAFSAGADDAEEAMQTTVDAAMFGKAALTDVFTAVDVLTTAVNAYGKEVVSTTQASDIFFNTIKEGKITGEELAGSIGTSIPLFSATGIALEELSAGLAAMTKQGVNASMATTQLNAIVNSFLKPSKDLTELLEEQGFASGAAFLETEGLAGALELLETATKGDATELAKLLPNIRALRGVMALTGVGGEEFVEILASMGDVAGATEEAFGKQEKTFDTLKNSMEKVMIVSGNIGKHFVDQIAVGATQAAEGMLKFLMSSQGMEFVADLAGKVAGAWELINITWTTVTEQVGPPMESLLASVGTLIQTLSGETSTAAGAFDLFAFVVNLVSSAFTIVAKAVEITILNITDMVKIVQGAGDILGAFWDAITGQASWDEVGNRFTELGETFWDVGENIVSRYTDFFDTVKDEAFTLFSDTEKTATEMKTKVTLAYDNMSDDVKSSWGEMITGQSDALEELLASMNSFVLDQGASLDDLDDKNTNTWENMLEGWEDYFDLVHDLASTAQSGILDTLSLAYEAQLNEQEFLLASQLSNLDSQLEAGLLTEEEYNIKKEAAEEAANAKMNSIKEKQFKADKANKIAGVWQDAASSIAGWWRVAPQLGPIGGIVFGATMTAFTTGMAIAQTALIAKQKFIPARAQGGMSSGLTRVNEEGGEIINLPDNSLVIPNDISRQIAGASSKNQTVINVSFAGANISDDISLDKIVNKVVKQLGRELRIA